MLLAFNQVGKAYQGTDVLRDITFRVNAGARIGLIGRNGSGKSTLLKIAEGTEQPDEGSVSRAAFTVTGYLAQDSNPVVDGTQTALHNKRLADLEAHLRDLEHQLQDAAATTGRDPHDLLEAYQEATARFESLGGYDHEHLLLQTLDGLGLARDALERPLASLSGGEQMRVRLARLLLQSPDILLLDEPTNHLDDAALEWLESYLSGFSGAVLLVSHDRTFLDRTVTSIAELEGGRIQLGPGTYTEYMERKRQNAEIQERAIQRLEKERDRQQDIAQTLRSHRKMTSYHSREKRVKKLSELLESQTKHRPKSGSPSMRIRFVPDQEPGRAQRTLLVAENLSKRYAGPPLFSDISFRLRANDRVALAGPNGCGKSTLLRILLGRETADSGDLWLSGVANIGTMGQFVSFDDESRTVLAEALESTGAGEGAVRSLLARFGFYEMDLHKKVSVLSGGERSRLFLCLMLEEHPDALFLDEPTNHLDIPSREILEDALASFPGAVLAVSHDRYFIRRCCTTVLGFTGPSIRPFPDYDAYRAAYRAYRPDPDKQMDEPKPERTRRKTGTNPVQIRREQAARRERIRNLETRIGQWEEEQKTEEQSFSADTLPETYRAYAERADRIEQAYTELMDLLEKQEEDER